MTEAKFFSEQLKLWRKSKGMTQEDLAKKIGKSRTIVSFLENGKQPPQVYHLELLKKAGIDLFDAIKDKKDNEKPHFGPPKETDIAASTMAEMYNSIREVKRDLLQVSDLFKELEEKLIVIPEDIYRALKVIEKIVTQANRKI